MLANGQYIHLNQTTYGAISFTFALFLLSTKYCSLHHMICLLLWELLFEFCNYFHLINSVVLIYHW